MNDLTTRLRTGLALGPRNIVRALSYRAGVRLGVHPAVRLRRTSPSGPFFRLAEKKRCSAHREQWRDHALAFGRWPFEVSDAPPDWLASPIDGVCFADADRPWWQIDDFAQSGDIKIVWELSRLDWAIAFAQQAACDDAKALARLDTWLADWLAHNPPFMGPNWKCGQEASIRVMHLAVAALVLNQETAPEPGLVALVELHLERIAPTIGYAMSQDNNHGTSEAAALFVGGSWLARTGRQHGDRWARLGRDLLEERVARLVGPSGGFSQYSVNYHRLMLDTVSLTEIWRRKLDLAPFSAELYDRAAVAARWLFGMTDATNGDAPNAGANDGARILRLTDEPYRDYRTTVQLAMAVFMNQRAYRGPLPGDAALSWLGIELPEELGSPPASYVDGDNGFAILRDGPAMALVRFPRFRFRPSQADALHVDFWIKGDNLLRDSGSFGYNAGEDWARYFNGTQGHNTVQFDGRDQMPRLGRFLFGDWLKADEVAFSRSDDGQLFAASYRDRKGASHRRQVTLGARFLDIIDEISGFDNSAVLRWRLPPGPITRDRNQLLFGCIKMTIDALPKPQRFECVEGWESRHYLERTATPVVEVEIDRAGTFHTLVTW